MVMLLSLEVFGGPTVDILAVWPTDHIDVESCSSLIGLLAIGGKIAGRSAWASPAAYRWREGSSEAGKSGESS
jgi:hypothetical protein